MAGKRAALGVVHQFSRRGGDRAIAAYYLTDGTFSSKGNTRPGIEASRLLPRARGCGGSSFAFQSLRRAFVGIEYVLALEHDLVLGDGFTALAQSIQRLARVKVRK